VRCCAVAYLVDERASLADAVRESLSDPYPKRPQGARICRSAAVSEVRAFQSCFR